MPDSRTGLLLIGGAKRNVGKTTLVNKIINKFSKNYPIVGLKIKTLYEGDKYFHGKDSSHFDDDFILIEESNKESTEDTGKMLKAGAQKAFRLKVKSHALKDAFIHFSKQINDNDYIICESNSLRKVIIPDLYLLVKYENEQNMKPSALELEEFANKIIKTDGRKHDFNIEKLTINKGKWTLK